MNSSLEFEAAVEDVPRSPSPAIPGAWPLPSPNTLHRRSNTFPAVSSHNLPPANSLHLDHVRRFQKRLSQTLFLKSAERASADQLDLSDSIPSDGSSLTRFTQLDTNTSLSMSGETSLTTSCSTPPKGLVTFSRYENAEHATQSASFGSKSPICNVSRDSMSKYSPQTSGCRYAANPPASFTLSMENTNHCPRFDFPTSLSSSSWSSYPSPDPVSPMSFSSPTSSNDPLPCQHLYHEHGCCPSLEFSASPSWETSFNTRIGDFDPLRVESAIIHPEPMLNPSQSQPFNTFNPHTNNDSSTELDIPTIPMLTTLSLPGSLDTSFDFNRLGHHSEQDNSHNQDSSMSYSPPSASEVTGTSDIRVLEFPSPPLTLSPFITAPPPESPIINLVNADSSAVEYASAIVSSSWGFDISIRPDYPIADILSSISSPSAPETTQDLGLRQEPTGRIKPSAMITRFKTLGRKLKRFLSLFPKTKSEGSISNRHEKSQGDLRNAHSSTSFNDIGDALAEAGSRNREDSSVRLEGNHLLPLPPGLHSSPTRRRSETCTSNTLSSHHTHDLTSPPLIKITSSSCSYRRPTTPTADECLDHIHSQDSIRTLEIEARPKTLEEIKSKRRLSLLSNTCRSTSQPGSSVVAVARTHQRPRSTIVLPATTSSSISGGAASNEIQNFRPLSNTANGTHEDEMTSIPGTLPAQTSTDIIINKKRRRFSLPALSHLIKFA